MLVKIKRVYEPSEPTDGKRVLIDRLWPRGLTKEKAKIDLWLKEIAPTTQLRKWFNHDPAKWPEFRQRYREEIQKNLTSVKKLQQLLKAGPVTLVYGAKDQEHNDAVVLQQYLQP